MTQGRQQQDTDAMRVLVVDDEALIRWSISEKMASHGYTAVEADNAASAVSALDADEKPDVVFLDYNLPDSKDLGLLRRIRQIAPRTAVIMMTAFGTAEMQQEALDLGAYRVLSKPFDLLQLPALAEDAIRHA
jgi:two-component system nitrogen regulation response regulator GlnG